MNRRQSLGVLAAAVVATGGAWLWRGQGGGPAIDLGAANAQDAAAVDTAGIPEMTIGKLDAPVKVTEYASFTCPHCRDFHNEVWKDLKKNYIDTGKIQFTYREVYFDRFGLWAAMLARCGGGMRYFGIVDILFETQADWLAGGDPAKIADNLKTIGRKAGMNDDDIAACLSDSDQAKKLVALYQQNAAADKVEGTPTFIIDGTKYSNMGYDDFAKILDAELAKKS